MRSPTDSCDGQSLLVFLHDILGFFIGRDAERKRVAAKIIAWMEALGIVSVPRLSIGGYADLLVAWPTAETSFMDPGTGVNVVHGAELAKLPAGERAGRRQTLLAQWELDTLPYGAAGRHLVHDVIDPADTRDVVIRFLEHSRTRTAIGRHRLAGWPTKF